MIVKSITLEGSRVRLEPLTLDDLDTLSEFGLNEDLWRFRPDAVTTRDEMRAYIERALSKQAQGAELGFVIIERASGRVAGSTRFMSIDTENRTVEIGGTFIDPRWQRTFLNTEAKYLMLQHAFESWRCIRVC